MPTPPQQSSPIDREEREQVARHLDFKAEQARFFGLSCLVASIFVGLVILGLFWTFSLSVPNKASSTGLPERVPTSLAEGVASLAATGIIRIGADRHLSYPNISGV